MAIKLTVTRSTGDGVEVVEHSFRKESITIGRAAGNDLLLVSPDRMVSSKHARIDKRGEAYFVTDVGSMNGSLLNDVKLESNHPAVLKSGDQLRLGVFSIKVLIEDEDFRTTLRRIDPLRLAARLADDLSIEYARHFGASAEERKRALQARLKSALASADPETVQATLTWVQERFKGMEQAPSQDAEQAKKKEALVQAGLEAIRGLSTRFVGETAFERPEDVEKLCRLIEQVLQVTFEWVSSCLKGRREFENQFDADLTLVFAKGGNPIKSAGSPADIGKYLLDWKNPRDPAVSKEALDSAFRDLTMHQLGLLAGVQECVRMLLQKLDPKVLEDQVVAESEGLGKLAAKLAVSKKAWQKYVATYQELLEENSKLFNEIIFPNIRKGYLASHASQHAPSQASRPGEEI
ncbi:MAG: type VI secretion system-associated FHA domain protein TagH [Planctomycetes bacterium]|nr:type VI secretion system-associated FHA domain protein TagH [Planctomycetota bacterium]